MSDIHDRPGFCLDCGKPIRGTYDYATKEAAVRCPKHGYIHRRRERVAGTAERIVGIKEEIGRVGIDDYCRVRYEREDPPVKLIENLRRAPILEYFEFARPANFTTTMTKARLAVLSLMAQGYNNKEIAEELGISRAAAADRVRSVLKVLKAKNRPNAIHHGHIQGLLDDTPPGMSRTISNWNGAKGWTVGRYDALFRLAAGIQIDNMSGLGGSSAAKDKVRACYHLLGAVNGAHAVHKAHLQGLLPSG